MTIQPFIVDPPPTAAAPPSAPPMVVAPPTGEIQLYDASVGEIASVVDARRLLAAAGLVDLTRPDIAPLATFTTNAHILRQVLDEAVGFVSDELVVRLTRKGKYTYRDDRFEIKTTGPLAGTVGYDSELMQAALRKLVDAEVIDEDGARGALEVIPATVALPYSTLRQLIAALDGDLEPGQHAALRDDLASRVLDEPAPELKQRWQGIKALLNIPAAKDAIVACEIALTPPRRKATVKPIARPS